MDLQTLLQTLTALVATKTLRNRDARLFELLRPKLLAGTLTADEQNDLLEMVADYQDAMPVPPPEPLDAPDMTNVQGGIHFGHAVIDTIEAIHQTNHIYSTPDSDPERLAILYDRYLSELCSTLNRVPLPDADTADKFQKEVGLDDIYTRLEVGSALEHSNADAAPGDTPLSTQVSVFAAVARRQRLVLLGAPGSGKSTFVHCLVLSLAQANRAYFLAQANRAHSLANTNREAEQARHFLAAEGWDAPLYTPILINLNRWSQWMKESVTAQVTPTQLVWTYLQSLHGEVLAEDLMKRAHQGQAILIFDGLDEVPVQEHGVLPQIKSSLQAVSTTSVAHMVVTCRVLDYQYHDRHLAGWVCETLLPFSDELQQDFIRRWYTTLDRLGRPLLDRAEVLRPKLQAAVRARTDLRRIAGNPLLLTMMALLHASKGELPEKRVELYNECLDLLLRRWRHYRDGAKTRESLEEHLAIPEWSRTDTELLLCRLGYVAQSQIDEHDLTSGAGTNLSEDLLIRTARDVFERFGVKNGYALAERFCAYITEHDNGILQRHESKVFRFPHRTFQEFLAARYLVHDSRWEGEERDLVNRLLKRSTHPAWREVLQLSVSKLVSDGNVRPVTTLIDKLLRQNRAGTRAWAQNSILAADLLVEVPRHRLKELGTHEAKLWDDTAHNLWRLLDPQSGGFTQAVINRLQGEKGRAVLDAPGRVRAGTALGYLVAPDLRINAMPRWCPVPAGEYRLGGDVGGGAAAMMAPSQRVQLESFQISQFPVTNAQYRQFMLAGGYTDSRWWDADGWKAVDQLEWTAPFRWEEARFSGDLHPVVGVSWFEAMAFTRWLSAHLGQQITLPTEAQWEAAARGPEALAYPWGKEWQDYCANTHNLFDGPTPVVCFATGMSWCGAYDMAGNVWEWTASDYTAAYPTNRVDTISINTKMAFRGGAWPYDKVQARSAYRSWNKPTYRDVVVGVRLVTTFSS